MDIYMKIKLTIGLLYFLQTLTYIQGEYTYTYVGCYKDKRDRALSGEYYKRNSSNTIEKCVDFCGEKNYTYAGLQFSRECFCGNSGYDIYGEGDDCTYPCTGNISQICGGGWHNSVYSISKAADPTTTTTATTTSTTSTTSTPSTTTFVATYLTDTTTTTSSTPTSSESITSANNKDQRSITKYIGIGVGAVAVCAIIVLVVVLVVRRRQHSGEDSNVSCQKTTNNPQMADSNMYVNASSADLSPKPKSTPGDDNLYAHYSVIGEHAYTVPEPETSSNNNQSADSNCEDEQVYILAEPLIDDLVVEDNRLYQ